ncbi:hypothetical protein M7I_6659 [Glarea lozoyensis 74030]|uniref:Uncharacterized protein n=1 Tax=Glarea lozoyensis (strain ATCC 74030 / MF5533) TaxID=1104152 RepID=H0EV65_GLAL7|nr:hypothetical protein M7I_6659 [Glarea lozoyensis 74030]
MSPSIPRVPSCPTRNPRSSACYRRSRIDRVTVILGSWLSINDLAELFVLEFWTEGYELDWRLSEMAGGRMGIEEV